MVDRESSKRGCMTEEVVTTLPIVLRPEPATVRVVGARWMIEVDGRIGGWTIEGDITNLPIVLKPKPATVKLVENLMDDSSSGGWTIDVDG